MWVLAGVGKRVWIGCLIFAAAFGASPSWSEKILAEVRVGDGARTVRGVNVGLERVGRSSFYRVGSQRTGVDGIARFENVPPGHYRLRLWGLGPTVVRGRNDPFSRPTKLTVIEPGNDDEQRVAVWLRSGVRTRFALAGVEADDRQRFQSSFAIVARASSWSAISSQRPRSPCCQRSGVRGSSRCRAIC